MARAANCGSCITPERSCTALTGTPAALRAELAALGLDDVTVHELAPGESL